MNTNVRAVIRALVVRGAARGSVYRVTAVAGDFERARDRHHAQVVGVVRNRPRKDHIG